MWLWLGREYTHIGACKRSVIRINKEGRPKANLCIGLHTKGTSTYYVRVSVRWRPGWHGERKWTVIQTTSDGYYHHSAFPGSIYWIRCCTPAPIDELTSMRYRCICRLTPNVLTLFAIYMRCWTNAKWIFAILRSYVEIKCVTMAMTTKETKKKAGLHDRFVTLLLAAKWLRSTPDTNWRGVYTTVADRDRRPNWPR